MSQYHVDKVNDASIIFEHAIKINLDDDSSVVTNKKLQSFTFKEETYRQKKYAQMLVDVIKLLDEENPNKLQKLAEQNFAFKKTLKGNAHITNDPERLYRPLLIRDNIFVESNFSAASILRFIKILIKEFKVDPSLFYISVANREDDNEEEEENF